MEYVAHTTIKYMIQDACQECNGPSSILEIPYDPLLEDSSMYELVDEYTMYPNDRFNGIRVYLYRPIAINIHTHRKSLYERMIERFILGKQKLPYI